MEKIATFENPGSGTGFGNTWSPSGDRIAVAGYLDSVLAWDVASRKQVLQAQHPGTVACVAWHPSGSTLVTGTSAGDVHLCESDSGRELARTRGHSDEVRSVAFSPNGELVASGANDGAIRIWKAADLAPVATVPGHNGLVRSVAWAPDGKMLVSGGHDNAVRCWSTETWQASGGLADHTGWVSAVAFSPDGKYLASGSSDSTLRIWDLAERRYHRVLGPFDGWWIFGFAFSPDSRRVAALTNDPGIIISDVETGAIILTETAPFGTTEISWSPDGRFIGASGYEVNLWAAPSPLESDISSQRPTDA